MRLTGSAILCLSIALSGCSGSSPSSGGGGGNASTAATPVFSIAAGEYSPDQAVSIADSTSGAAIYYTTNGSTPTASSTLYTGAITLSASETLSAIATASGYNNSAVASAAYVISSGTISTYAGVGIAGYIGDAGAATSAEISAPIGIAMDSGGNLYIADAANNRVRKVTAAGLIYTYAGNGTAGYAGDGGTATSAELSKPSSLVLDSSGNLYISDQSNARIRKVTAAGIISTYAGNGTCGYGGDGGAATSAEICYAVQLALDSNGNLYIADAGNYRVRKVTAAGIISTVAGIGNAATGSGKGYTGDGGPATSAELNGPFGIALDSSGNLYLADSFNNRIREVNTAGIISTVVGNGTAGYGGDGGAALGAELNEPGQLAMDGNGNLYIADLLNERVRKVTTTGIVSTVAGNGTLGYSGDGGAATSAQLSDPAAVALDSSGSLYISDELNNRIRKVTY